MSKRSCPFDDTLAPQLKVHVAQKHVDVTDKLLLEKVYDKTFNLLYEGSKKIFKDIDNTKEKSCCKNSAGPFTKCWYCENQICIQCVRTCAACGETFCKNCAMNSYEESGGDFTCLTCMK